MPIPGTTYSHNICIVDAHCIWRLLLRAGASIIQSAAWCHGLPPCVEPVFQHLQRSLVIEHVLFGGFAQKIDGFRFLVEAWWFFSHLPGKSESISPTSGIESNLELGEELILLSTFGCSRAHQAVFFPTTSSLFFLVPFFGVPFVFL